eukprot:595264-Rhodomonas_salina.2
MSVNKVGLVLFLCIVAAGADETFLRAFRSTFSRNDKALVSSMHTPAVRWIQDIMQQQGVPYNATELRALDDSELLAVAMRAAIAGISHWKRVPGSAEIVVNEKTGIPYQENMTVDLEIPVYISIICVMVATIVLQHMRLHRGGSPLHSTLVDSVNEKKK